MIPFSAWKIGNEKEHILIKNPELMIKVISITKKSADGATWIQTHLQSSDIDAIIDSTRNNITTSA